MYNEQYYISYESQYPLHTQIQRVITNECRLSRPSESCKHSQLSTAMTFQYTIQSWEPLPLTTQTTFRLYIIEITEKCPTQLKVSLSIVMFWLNNTVNKFNIPGFWVCMHQAILVLSICIWPHL